MRGLRRFEMYEMREGNGAIYNGHAVKEPVALACFWTEYPHERPEDIARGYYGIKVISAVSVKAFHYDGFVEMN
jgi:hypothetical protein